MVSQAARQYYVIGDSQCSAKWLLQPLTNLAFGIQS